MEQSYNPTFAAVEAEMQRRKKEAEKTTPKDPAEKVFADSTLPQSMRDEMRRTQPVDEAIDLELDLTAPPLLRDVKLGNLAPEEIDSALSPLPKETHDITNISPEEADSSVEEAFQKAA